MSVSRTAQPPQGILYTGETTHHHLLRSDAQERAAADDLVLWGTSWRFQATRWWPGVWAGIAPIASRAGSGLRPGLLSAGLGGVDWRPSRAFTITRSCGGGRSRPARLLRAVTSPNEHETSSARAQRRGPRQSDSGSRLQAAPFRGSPWGRTGRRRQYPASKCLWSLHPAAGRHKTLCLGARGKPGGRDACWHGVPDLRDIDSCKRRDRKAAYR